VNVKQTLRLHCKTLPWVYLHCQSFLTCNSAAHQNLPPQSDIVCCFTLSKRIVYLSTTSAQRRC